MTRLASRLAALEGAAPKPGGSIDLDAVSTADLEQLEGVCARVEALTAQGMERSAAVETLSSADLHLIARLPLKGNA
ncbi:MAG: hypothetical protein KKE77_12775 [Alphaproteobacteria bacterium]|nr:hypothetical protein [Alphaproteobacteria bacterium]